jgi:beta-N-acetylhexosaminidase
MRRAALMVGAVAALAACGGDVEVPRADTGAGGAGAPGAATTAAGATTPAATTPVATATARTRPAPPAPARLAAPRIHRMAIPFPPARRRQMAAYSRRHYGEPEWRLRDPRLIVQHFSQTSTARAVYDIFARNRPDPELGELPGTCAHFVVSRRGTIYQLVGLGTRCRHAFGVNHVSIGIEHVGSSDGEVMSNRRQLAASLALTRWLRCRYSIAVGGVIGHAETIRSPFYLERDERRFPRETHSDFSRRTMAAYRRALARRPCP